MTDKEIAEAQALIDSVVNGTGKLEPVKAVFPESRGAMTAQQFAELIGDRIKAETGTVISQAMETFIAERFDALAAHNTAPKESEWKAILDNACLCEFCAAKYEALSGEKHRASKALYESVRSVEGAGSIDWGNSNGRCMCGHDKGLHRPIPACGVALCPCSIFRPVEGARPWEAAAREAAKEIKTSPTGHMTCRLSEGHIFDIILKHVAGLASPPEGKKGSNV